MRFYLERANKLQRQYQDYTAELRRRYPLGVKILKRHMAQGMTRHAKEERRTEHADRSQLAALRHSRHQLFVTVQKSTNKEKLA
jgi:hypothetical protein